MIFNSAGQSADGSALAPMYAPSVSCALAIFQPTVELVPVLDESDPCCVDFSTITPAVGLCDTGPRSGPGSTGPLEAPAGGTWTNSLNATGGGAGGGSGASWIIADPPIAESWGN